MNKLITFVIPSRNNLEFLKLSYKSLKDLKNPHHILILDDASSDGTKQWWINGLLCRGDGPAIEWSNGDKEWYIDGIQVEPF